jgi:hypothetical protein
MIQIEALCEYLLRLFEQRSSLCMELVLIWLLDLQTEWKARFRFCPGGLHTCSDMFFVFSIKLGFGSYVKIITCVWNICA